MSDYRVLVHRDPIQRDPVYAALRGPMGKDSALVSYVSVPFWSWIVGFILSAVVLMFAYGGSQMRMAQHEVWIFPPPTRITSAPIMAPAPLVPAPANPGALSPAR